MYSAITFQQNPWFMLYEAENFVRCLLLVVHYFLLVARCSLPFVCCSLVFARCPSIFAACLLLFPRCLLLFARWLLLFALCSLFIHPNYGEINYCEPQKKWLDYNETPPQIFSLQNSKILVTFSGWQFSKFPQHVKPFFRGDIKSQILPELISLWCFITISGHVFLYFYVLEEPEVVVRKISIKKVFLNIPHNSQKNICAGVSFAITWRPATSLNTEFDIGAFFIRITISQMTAKACLEFLSVKFWAFTINGRGNSFTMKELRHRPWKFLNV